MKHDELVSIANRRGFVQWWLSRRVERLRITKNGIILATRLLTNEEHYISPRDEHWCSEIKPNTFVCVGDVLW